MNVLPTTRMSPSDWASAAWAEAWRTSKDGAALTVPASAIEALLIGYLAARHALEKDVRAVLENAVEIGTGRGIARTESHD